jgi:hypothetical protein
MSAAHDADRLRRRRLRLGALLFQLQYYMQAPADIADAIYLRDAATYVQVAGTTIRFVQDGEVETLDLETAIDRCKEALVGAPLHRTLNA